MTSIVMAVTSAIALAPGSARAGAHGMPAARHAATASRRPGSPGHAAPVTQTAGHHVTGHAVASSGVTGHEAAVTAGQQASVRRYWTRARMEHAIPLLGAASGVIGAAGSSAGLIRGLLRAPVTGSPRTGAGLAPAPAGPGSPPAGRHSTRASARSRGTAGKRAPGRTSGHATAPLDVPPQAPMSAPEQQQQSAAATAAQAWTGEGAVGRTTGKVFFTMGSEDYVCSGSTVASADADVVVTAAHCVQDGTDGWATNWTFVPGYVNGNDPYGSFTASQFYVASQWSAQADNDYDVAFVKLNPASEGDSQVPVVAEVGGQGIEFGSQPAQETAFGYPADPPYNGQQLYYCSGAVRPDPYHETHDSGLACALTAGSSGGPWLTGFDAAAGTGMITAVSSFKYSNDDQVLYGTPLGAVAQKLYEAAQYG